MTPQGIALLQTHLGEQAVGAADGIMGKRTRAAFGGDHAAPAKYAEVTGCPYDDRGDPDYARYLTSVGMRDVVSHGAAGVGGKFVPRGIVIHHTGADSTRDTIPAARMIDGRAGLRGPLVQFGVSRDQTVGVYTNGRAHHAGPGSRTVLNAVLKDRPLPSGKPGADGPSGNTYFLGIEVDHSGQSIKHGNDSHWLTAVRLAAELCDLWDWPTSRVIGHSEWTRRKVDPIFPMDRFRDLVELDREALRPVMSEPAALAPPAVPADLVIPEHHDLDGAIIEHRGIPYRLVKQ